MCLIDDIKEFANCVFILDVCLHFPDDRRKSKSGII